MPTIRAENITIDGLHERQRIDNYLIGYFKGVPKTRIYRSIRKGETRVNKKRVDASYRLRCGDEVRLPPLRQAEKPRMNFIPGNIQNLLITRILYEDNDLLILNKPAGIPVHGGSGTAAGIIEYLRLIFKYPYLELAHRLDKATSGCLVLAKKPTMLKYLHELMRTGAVEKSYQALVLGRWPVSKSKVILPLVRNQTVSGERMVRVNQQGQYAETQFKVLEYYPQATLVEARLITGRTHQIRVHCSMSGHPIAGDEKYGDKAFNRMIAKKGLKRMFLHAQHLNFPTREASKLSVDAVLDQDLLDILIKLKEGNRTAI